MFFKKIEIKQVKSEQVKCEECKHWVDTSDAHMVRRYSPLGMFEQYYCPMHKKPYNEVIVGFFPYSEGAWYFGRVKMTEDGTPVGYVKQKSKK